MPEYDLESFSIYLTRRLLTFCRHLRSLGLSVGSSQVADFLRALREIDIKNPTDFYYAAQASLVNRAEDRELFAEAFARFWGGESPVIPSSLPRTRAARGGGRGAKRPSAGGELGAAEEGVDRGRYSPYEILRLKDFGELTKAELEEMKAFIRDLGVDLGERRSRRYQSGAGSRPDFRRSLRRNIRKGSEWLHWARRERKRQQRPLVLLADVSGSMERYSRLLLAFGYGLVKGLESEIEAFVFGTRLTRITRALQTRTVDEALEGVAAHVPDWAGGTRIGESLRTFNVQWARRVLAREAVVLLVSDGWDRGEPEDLAREVGRLGRQAGRLIWLNPLLGRPGYRPLTRGMQVALTYIDDFLPVNNLASLQELADHLRALPPERVRGLGTSTFRGARAYARRTV